MRLISLSGENRCVAFCCNRYTLGSGKQNKPQGIFCKGTTPVFFAPTLCSSVHGDIFSDATDDFATQSAKALIFLKKMALCNSRSMNGFMNVVH